MIDTLCGTEYYWVAETDDEVLLGFDPEKVCASSRLLEGKKVRRLVVLSWQRENTVLKMKIPEGYHPVIAFERTMHPGGELPETQIFGYEKEGHKVTWRIVDGEAVLRGS